MEGSNRIAGVRHWEFMSDQVPRQPKPFLQLLFVEDSDLLQDMTVQHHALIHVSSYYCASSHLKHCLSLGEPSPIAAGLARASSSSAMTFHFAMMVEKAAVRGRERRRGSGKARAVDQRASTLLTIYLLDPQGQDETAAQEATPN
jgi:hypothetical protein